MYDQKHKEKLKLKLLFDVVREKHVVQGNLLFHFTKD